MTAERFNIVEFWVFCFARFNLNCGDDLNIIVASA